MDIAWFRCCLTTILGRRPARLATMVATQAVAAAVTRDGSFGVHTSPGRSSLSNAGNGVQENKRCLLESCDSNQ